MLLVGIEEKNTPNALVVPRRGDYVSWVVGVPGISSYGRSGIVDRVVTDPFDGWVFDATMDDGQAVWGWLGNILSINGELVANTQLTL